MNAVAVVPARGGSKGIPNKNLQKIAGISLVGRSVLALKAVTGISQVYVSSDSFDILQVGQNYGAESIARPPEFSADTSSTEDALIHFLDEIEHQGVFPDILVYLQCTSPFTTSDQVSAVLKMLLQNPKLDCVFSAIEDHAFLWRVDADGKGFGVNHDAYSQRNRRQDLGKTYKESGAIYAIRVKAFKETKNRFGRAALPISFPKSLPFEIDDPFDLALSRHVAPLFPVLNNHVDLKSCKALVMDFDGVHTNDHVYVCDDGSESVVCSRADGLGIGLLKKAGFHLLILTREENPVVRKRAAKLDIEIIHGEKNKLQALKEWSSSHNLENQNIAYVGNDVNDLECIEWVGCSFAPSDAHPKILVAVDTVLSSIGGEGVIRELADILLLKRENVVK